MTCRPRIGYCAITQSVFTALERGSCPPTNGSTAREDDGACRHRREPQRFMSSDSSDAVSSETVPDYSSRVFRQQSARGTDELDSIGESTPDGIPMLGSVSRGFAPDESEGVRRHLGLDIAAREGTPVYATAGGIVEFADWDENFGNHLIIDHIDGYKTHFGHNRALLVSVGDVVRRGELVALSGNTGRSSAPHLHYEIRHHGEPVDPANYMDVESLKQVE